MNYTKLSNEIDELLQLQYKHELENSFLYKDIGNYFKDRSLNNMVSLYEKQYNEERSHAEKVGNYLLDKKCVPKSPEMKQITNTYSDIEQVLLMSLEREKGTTEMLKTLAAKSFTSMDFQTFTIAQEMLKEQIEEEALFINLLDEVKNIGKCPGWEFLFDKHLSV